MTVVTSEPMTGPDDGAGAGEYVGADNGADVGTAEITTVGASVVT